MKIYSMSEKSYDEGWVLGIKTEVVYLPDQNKDKSMLRDFKRFLNGAVRTVFSFSFGFGILLKFSFKIEVWIQSHFEIGYSV